MHYQIKYLTNQQITYEYKIMHYQMKYLTKQQITNEFTSTNKK